MPAIPPRLGVEWPNDAFSEVPALPTIWVLHSYAACSQHAPNEHLPSPIAREGLAFLAGLNWELCAADPAMLTHARSGRGM
ncbi:hypothetical protein GCM10010991_36420 [Gemmobacter aquaticus]|uniref:Uncharacterized protein n=1 Tax=Gemmobacter aquaticus TaxID=490185 RepID=A0A917YPI2_9RHOB|nr:hypothetical protein GCM10010991_36420 [Gemmobacter aquaticus]